MNLTFDVTVLDHNGVRVPGRIGSLSAGSVALKAGASGGTTVRIDRSALPGRPGFYAAEVTARTAGGVQVSTTPVAFFVEPPSQDLTVVTTPMAGLPAGVEQYVGLSLINLDDPAMFAGGDFFVPGRTETFRVPDGHYSLMASYSSYDLDTGNTRAASVGDADVTIGADRTWSPDPVLAKPLTADVAGVRTDPDSIMLTFVHTAPRGLSWFEGVTAWGDRSQPPRVSVARMGRPTVGKVITYASFSLAAAGAYYDVVRPYTNGIPADPASAGCRCRCCLLTMAVAGSGQPCGVRSGGVHGPIGPWRARAVGHLGQGVDLD